MKVNIRFITSCPSNPGDDQEVITDHAVIARAYVRGWFSLDFLSTMPWSRIVDAFVGSDGGGALLHVAKLAKILGETGGETGGEICMLSKQNL